MRNFLYKNQSNARKKKQILVVGFNQLFQYGFSFRTSSSCSALFPLLSMILLMNSSQLSPVRSAIVMTTEGTFL
jgi:hypothetical protein